MKRFEKYIQDDIAKAADGKRERLTEEVNATKQADLVVGAEGTIGDEPGQLDAAIRPMITVFPKGIEERLGHRPDVSSRLTEDTGSPGPAETEALHMYREPTGTEAGAVLRRHQ